MHSIIFLFASLSYAAHGRRAALGRLAEKRESVESSDESVKSSGASSNRMEALAQILLKANLADAFNPSTVGKHSSPIAHRQLGRRPPTHMQEAAVDEWSEKRIDSNDGGIFTKAEFKEFYKENFEEEWAKAQPAGDIKTLSELKMGEEVKATVKTIVAFGAFCDIGAETDALLHITEICDEFVEDIYSKLEVGQELKAWIKNIDMQNGRLGISAKDQRGMKTLDQFNVGDEVDATVKRLMPFGAFCDIGTTTNALLHISEISNEFISDVREKLSEGDKLKARIKEVQVDAGKIAISCRDPNDMGGGGPAVDPNATPLEELEVGQEVEGTVKSIADFGAFVDIGAQKDALLHASEISDDYVSHPSDFLSMGEVIKARIKEVDVGAQRLGITMKSGDGGGDGGAGYGDEGY